MAYVLSPRYGKQTVPVFKIRKTGAHHEIVDMTVQIMLEGSVSKSWLTGDNCEIVPTETQKNTCYALALKTEFDSLEDYCLALARDMLRRHKHIKVVTIDGTERVWSRVSVDGKPHNHVFFSGRDPHKRSTHMRVTNDTVSVTSGIVDIKLMKTTQSGFLGYIKDEYTNLQPVGAGGSSPDRVMCTEMKASWTYSSIAGVNFKTSNAAILETLLAVFAGPPDVGVFSKSLQETAYNMATTVLDKFPSVGEVSLVTPNIHHYPYPLEQFGMSNPNIVFQSTDCHTTASGRIETRLTRPSAKL